MLSGGGCLPEGEPAVSAAEAGVRRAARQPGVPEILEA